jgi:hypothetical protein
VIRLGEEPAHDTADGARADDPDPHGGRSPARPLRGACRG